MKDRVFTVTRQDILDVRRKRVAAYGLDLAWLERLEHETDTRTVASWLEDHNFYALAEDWVTWSWLLDGKDPA